MVVDKPLPSTGRLIDRTSVWRARHAQLQQNLFCCHLCVLEEPFANFAALAEHVQSEHSDRTVHLYTCTACNEAVRSRSAYVAHKCRKWDRPEKKVAHEMTVAYLGLTCAECGLYASLSAKGTRKEWKAFCKLMSRHSQASLVPLLVHAVKELEVNPKAYVSLVSVNCSLDDEELTVERCSCGVRAKGEIQMKKHSLEACPTTEMATSGARLALVVRVGAGDADVEDRDTNDDTHERLARMKERMEAGEAGPSNELDRRAEFEARLQRATEDAEKIKDADSDLMDECSLYGVDDESGIHQLNLVTLRGIPEEFTAPLESSEATSIAARFAFRAPVEIPIFSEPSSKMPHTPHGLVASIYGCSGCKQLMAGREGRKLHTCKHAKPKVTQYFVPGWGLPNARILCPHCERCPHSVCSVLGLQIHLAITHNMHYKIDPEMDFAISEIPSGPRLVARGQKITAAELKALSLTSTTGKERKESAEEEEENGRPARKRAANEMNGSSDTSVQSDSSLSRAHSTSRVNPTMDESAPPASSMPSDGASTGAERERPHLVLKIQRDPTTKHPLSSSICAASSASSSRKSSLADCGLRIDEDADDSRVENEDTVVERAPAAAQSTVVGGSRTDDDGDEATVHGEAKEKEVSNRDAVPTTSSSAEGAEPSTSGGVEEAMEVESEDEIQLVGETVGGTISPDFTQKTKGVPKVTFGLPPKSTYLPVSSLFRLCRLCMTAMPPSPSIFYAHMQKHSPEEKKMRSCGHCSLMLPASKKEKKHHEKNHHHLKSLCTSCQKTYYDESAYYLHLVRFHSIDLIYYCKKCSIASKTLSVLLSHCSENDCGDMCKLYTTAVPGVLGECSLSFEGGLEPGGELQVRWGPDTMFNAKPCKARPDCEGRSLVVPRWDVSRQLSADMIKDLFLRVSCPEDFFLLPFTKYSSHDIIPHKKKWHPEEEDQEELKRAAEGAVKSAYAFRDYCISKGFLWTAAKMESNHSPSNSTASSIVSAPSAAAPTAPAAPAAPAAASLKRAGDSPPPTLAKQPRLDPSEESIDEVAPGHSTAPPPPAPADEEEGAEEVAPVLVAAVTPPEAAAAPAAAEEEGEGGEESGVAAAPVLLAAVTPPDAAAVTAQEEPAADEAAAPVVAVAAAEVAAATGAEPAEETAAVPTAAAAASEAAPAPAAASPIDWSGVEKVAKFYSMSKRHREAILPPFLTTGRVAFSYTEAQRKAARLPRGTPDETEHRGEKCMFCRSDETSYGVPAEAKNRWISAFIASAKDLTNRSFTGYFQSLNRVCAAHFLPEDIDEEGALSSDALPRYHARECLICEKAVLTVGLEIQIKFDEQLQQLVRLPVCKRSLDELRAICQREITFTCREHVYTVAAAFPLSLPDALRISPEEAAAHLERKRATTEKERTETRAKMEPSPAAAAAAASTAGSVVSGASDEAKTLSLLRDFSSAKRHAILEPPTPAAAVRPASPDDDDLFAAPLAPLQQLLANCESAAMDLPPATPAAQRAEKIGEIRRGMLHDYRGDSAAGPSTSAASAPGPSAAPLGPPTVASLPQPPPPPPSLTVPQYFAHWRQLQLPLEVHVSCAKSFAESLRASSARPNISEDERRNALISHQESLRQLNMLLMQTSAVRPRTIADQQFLMEHLKLHPQLQQQQPPVQQPRAPPLVQPVQPMQQPRAAPQQQQPPQGMLPPQQPQPQPQHRGAPAPQHPNLAYLLQQHLPNGQLFQAQPPVPRPLDNHMPQMQQVHAETLANKTKLREKLVQRNYDPRFVDHFAVLDKQSIREILYKNALHHLNEQQKREQHQLHLRMSTDDLLNEIVRWFERDFVRNRVSMLAPAMQQQQQQAPPPQVPAAQPPQQQQQRQGPAAAHLQQQLAAFNQREHQQQRRHQPGPHPQPLHPPQPLPNAPFARPPQQGAVQQQQQQQQPNPSAVQHHHSPHPNNPPVRPPQQQQQQQQQAPPQAVHAIVQHLPLPVQPPAPPMQQQPVQQMQPGGSSQQMQPGGSSQQMQPGGSSQQMQPGGNSQQMQPGGNSQQMQPGGSSQQMQPGGSLQQMQTGGSSQQPQRDVSQQQASWLAKQIDEAQKAAKELAGLATPSRYFTCALCGDAHKGDDVEGARFTGTKDVLLVLKALAIPAGTSRHRSLVQSWGRRVDKIVVCQQHLEDLDAMNLGTPCANEANCGQACNRLDVRLHDIHNDHKVRFACLLCHCGIGSTEQEAVRHFMQTHSLTGNDLPNGYQLDCPYNHDDQKRGEVKCAESFTSPIDYGLHVRNNHANALLVLGGESHKCSLLFSTLEARQLHEYQFKKDRERLEMENSAEAACCPLCGSADLWEDRIEGENVSHFTLHALEWTLLCRFDLIQVRRGQDARNHFGDLHHDTNRNACIPCGEVFRITSVQCHDDDHVVIGLSINEERVKKMHSSDICRATIGLPAVGLTSAKKTNTAP